MLEGNVLRWDVETIEGCTVLDLYELTNDLAAVGVPIIEPVGVTDRFGVVANFFFVVYWESVRGFCVASVMPLVGV